MVGIMKITVSVMGGRNELTIHLSFLERKC